MMFQAAARKPLLAALRATYEAEAKVGDQVRIEETRPLSKIKHWRLVAVVERGSAVERVAV